MFSDARLLWSYYQARAAGEMPRPISREDWEELAKRYPHQSDRK